MVRQVPAVIPVDDEESIRKAHQAIAIVPSKGNRITLLMRRFFNVLLHHAQEHKQRDKETYRLELSEILSGAAYDSSNLEVAKGALRQMAKTPVEWNSINDEGERRWGVSALLADAEIAEEHGKLVLEWSYSPKVRIRLLDPELYVRLSLRMYSSLRSSTSAALYEVCVRYVTNFGGLTNRAHWQWWRPRLTGIPDSDPDSERVSEYKYFKRDTLAPAIREINNLTDIVVEVIEFKDGRRIAEIQFSVAKKKQQDLRLDDKNLVDNQLLDRIERLGFTKIEAAKIYSSKEEGTIRATIDYTEARIKKKNLPTVESPAAFFRDALKKGYGKDGAGPTKAPIPPRLTESVKADPLAAEARMGALALFDGMEDEARNEVLHQFAVANPALASQMRKNANSVAVRKALAGWLVANKAGKPA